MRHLLLLLIGFTIFNTHAQVGINTTKPLGVFHIDPKSNTGGTAVAPTNDSDDIIVTREGNVGIGTANPTAKLHIKTAGTRTSPISGLQLQDGSEGINKVLVTQDATGVASWRNIPGSWFCIMTGGSLGFQTPFAIAPIKFTRGKFSKDAVGASFDLPNGKVKLPFKGTYRVILSGKVDINRAISPTYNGAYIAMLKIIFDDASITNFSPHSMVDQSLADGAYISYGYNFECKAGVTVQFALGATVSEYANKVDDTQVIIEYIQE